MERRAVLAVLGHHHVAPQPLLAVRGVGVGGDGLVDGVEALGVDDLAGIRAALGEYGGDTAVTV
jgi:hypothetical protein